jgi:DMSO/TMAO reductase YedYZ molybdopterin-dependent catalytic subunit
MSAPDPRLPPGQALTRKFPVVGENEPAPDALDLEHWRLRMDGLVERRLELSWADLLALPQAERTADIHCVTGWSRFGTRFVGVPLAELLALSGVSAGARFARFEAYSRRGHDTSLPLALARADAWLVHTVDGEPLTPEHGYPLRVLLPSRYFYKSLKWVHRIELLAEDRLGYWERESAYHNGGDPWAGDQRFASGSIDPEAVARLREATSFERWRFSRKVLIGLDLRGWVPRSRDLRGLQLKSCDLRAAELAGCDLSGANLSLSDLRGAFLRGADLRDADLEGANLAGADLRDADLSGAALSATRFFERTQVSERAEGAIAAIAASGAALVEGMRWQDTSGLLEEQEDFLREHAGGH